MEKTFILGENTPTERALIENGDIREIGGSFSELKNKYYIRGRGDLAMKGEKIIIKDDGKPYR